MQFFIILFPLDVVEHRHLDDPVFEVLWLYVLPLQVHLDLLEHCQCCKSWEFFHSNSIAFHQDQLRLGKRDTF